MLREARSMSGTVVAVVLLLGGTVALFSRALPYGFINYDDPAFVVNNPHVQQGLSLAGVRWAFAVDRDYWHPLTWLSLMLDRTLWGGSPTAFRAVNVVLHAVNTLLVFAILRRMRFESWVALGGAVLFAWHPQRVESVVWITERKDVLSGCFALLAVWAWLVRGGARGRAGSMGWYAVSWLAFACGVMSKPVVVALPLVLMLLDVWPLGRWESGRWRLVVEKAPFFALSLLVGLFTVSTQESTGSFTLALTLDQRVVNAVVSIVRYLGMAAWPAGLAVVYPHPGDWPLVVFGAAGLAVAALTALAWGQRHERPAVMVGWGWFLVMLLPSLGLVQVGLQAMADRYTYLPAVGLALALGGLVGPLVAGGAGARVRMLAAAGVVVAGALVLRTWGQQAVWRDAGTLFSHAIAVTRDNHVARCALALERLALGRVAEAAQLVDEALALAPDAPLVLDTLGAVRMAQGRIDDAVAAYRRVIAQQPRTISARCDLGRLLLEQGRVEEASELFAEAVSLRPGSAVAHLGLADVAIARGRPQEALTHLSRALELAPRDARTTMRVAAVQLQVGRSEQAVATLEFAAGLEPDNLELQRDIGDILGRLGRFEQAASAYERAVRLAPGDAATQARLGYAYFLIKRPADAIRCWEEARRLDPGMVELDSRIRQARALLPAGP